MTAAAHRRARGPRPATRRCCSATATSPTRAGRLRAAARGGRGAASCDLAVAAFERKVGGGLGFAKGYARRAIRELCGLETTAPISGQRAMRAAVLARRAPVRAPLRDGDRDDGRRGPRRPPGRRGRARPQPPGDRPDPRRLRPPRPPAARLPSPSRGRAAGAGPHRLAPVILAIDQGTTGTHLPRLRRGGRDRRPRLLRVRAVLPAARLGRARRRRDLGGHPPGRARGARRRRHRRRPTSSAIGITNQRETVVGWDRGTGEPIHHALVWQDRRTAARCERARARRATRTWSASAPASSSTPTSPARRSSGCCATSTAPIGRRFGTIDSWLVHKLCGEHVTDLSNASRTMLLDIRQRALGPGALRAARRRSRLAARAARLGRGLRRRPASSAARFRSPGSPATSRRPCSARPATRPATPRTPTGPAASSCSTRGDRAARSGRGPARHDRLGARRRDDLRARGVGLRHRLGRAVAARRARPDRVARPRPRSSRRSLDSNDDVYFVPALTGLGSPYWDPYARGALLGLTRGTGRAQIARATLEAIAYQTVDAVRAQEAASGEAAERAARRRRRGRQRVADAVPGRRPRRPGGRPRDRRDDGARRRLPRRHRRRASGTSRASPAMWRERVDLRAADVRRRARVAARPLARGGRALAGLGARLSASVSRRDTGS